MIVFYKNLFVTFPPPQKIQKRSCHSYRQKSRNAHTKTSTAFPLQYSPPNAQTASDNGHTSKKASHLYLHQFSCIFPAFFLHLRIAEWHKTRKSRLWVYAFFLCPLLARSVC